MLKTMKKAKFTAIFSFALIIIMALAGCPGEENSGDNGSDSAGSEDSNVSGDTASTGLVGAILSLTGEYYQYGSSIKDGIELAEDDINSQGGVNGKNFKVVIEDSQSTVEGAKAALDRLAENGVKVAIGPEISELCQELIPYAVEKKIILISPSATAPELRELSAKAKGYFFRICATDDSEAGQLAIEMVRTSRWKFIKRSYKRALVIIRKNNAFTEGFWRALGKEFMEKNIEYQPVRFEGEDVTDFPENPEDYHPKIKAILKAARNYQKNPDDESKMGAIVLLGFAHEVEFFLRAFDRMKLDAQIYTTSAVDTKEFMENAADVAVGIVFPKMFDQHNVETDLASKFIFNYYEKKKRNPDLFVAYGYDAGMLLGLTMRREGIEEIVNEPYNFRLNMNDVKYHGLTGAIDFNNSNNEVNKTPTLYILEKDAVATTIKEYEGKTLKEAMKKIR
jgi:branched-chain amino acid transport system substrate-binding protein